MGRLQFLAVLTIGFGTLFENLEFVMSGILGAVFAVDVEAGRMSQTHLAMLLGATSVGAALGSPLLGLIADWVGRRIALIAALVCAALFSLAGALTRTTDELIAMRLLASFGMGAYLPLATAYIGEIIPRRFRGRALMINAAIGGFGGLLSGLLARYFIESTPLGPEGWRGAMVVGALGALLCAVIVPFLPESPRWLAAKGFGGRASNELKRMTDGAAFGRVDASRVQVSAPVASTLAPGRKARIWDAEYRGRMALVAALQLGVPWCTASIAAFIGWVFSHRGYGLGDAALLQGIVTLGVPIGAVLGMIFVDRMTRPTLLIGSGIVVAVCALGFTLWTWLPAAIVTGALITTVSVIYTWVLMLYTAEIFPPLLSGKANTIAYALNRASALAVPFVILPLLINFGEIGMFGVMAAVMLASSALLASYVGWTRPTKA